MNLRLVTAEFLKLRKRRGLVAALTALTILPMVIAYAVLLFQDGPAGGMENFIPSMDVLVGLTLVAAILVGATLGTGDVGSGVFRELVVTGRSRVALFAARIPAGLALLLPIVGAGFAVTASASIVLAGSEDGPSGRLLVESFGWLALTTAASMVLALGVSSVIGSRGTSIGILLGWWLVATPVLLMIGALGSLREGLVVAAVDHLEPVALREGPPAVSTSTATAVAVLLAWTAVPLALGAWRTATRDA
jgi:ABC-type transport system involved in multi-copper enzyme maturation permease subunit